MAEKLVLEPSADHPITIAPNSNHVTVRYGDTVLADTRAAVTLSEASYPSVLYIPLADVDQQQLVRTDHESYCPFKGDASYYSIPAAGEGGENAVWEYRDPYPAVSEIKDTVAFYADRIEITEEP
jgi:uncharacterized protein (DUF427 family)